MGLNFYDYGARNYDPALGRFFGIDPISEDYYYQTNYQFASNNPVWKIEIEGLEGQMTNDGTDLQDDKTFLDGWNSTVRNFNNNFYSGVNDFFEKPIETTDNIVANTIIGTAQFIGDVTGLNTLLGLENKTVDAIASFIQNAPNMNAEQAGAAAAIIFIEGAEVVITHKMPTMSKGSNNVDFVVSPDGVAVPKNQQIMRDGFDNAGFSSKSATGTAESGVIHTVPTKNGNVDIRTMEGSAKHPKRAVITHPNTNSPKTPSGKATRNKEDNHIEQF
ncbi:RHS repeat-associated core domain-containing protein [Flavobacterium sp.]|uniref:RHS repeat-associated core domain-containing protein n=2 Tax=Flavobacterium sp. TaxID=239 RepID=UPI004047661C